MFNKLTVSNFQKHKGLVIEFDPLMTVIVGGSDRGKSSVLRALRWLCQNRPGGDSFVSHGEEYARVGLEVDNHTVIREKGKGVNSYHLDETDYHALGAGGIPESVSNLLNVSDVNFQGQMDSPFWLSLTAGEVSKELNSIVNLSLMDRTLANLNGKLKKSKSNVSVSEDRLKKSLGVKESLSWVEEANKGLERIEVLQSTIESKVSRIDAVASCLQEVESADQELLGVSQAVLNAQKWVDVGDVIYKHKKDLVEVEYLLERHENLCQEEKTLQKECSDLVKKLSELTGGICPICRNLLK